MFYTRLRRAPCAASTLAVYSSARHALQLQVVPREPQPAVNNNNRFWCHDGNQLTEPMGVSTGYTNNFHTSRYSGRTEWFARAKSARYWIAKFDK